MTWAHGPVVTRRRLGRELKALRDAAGKKLEDVATALDCSTSKISRLETGKGVPRWRDVRDILDLYGVPDGEFRDRMLSWAQDGRARMWWQDYADVLSSATATYVELEWDATRIRAYEAHIVHGLLQTRDYARGVLVSALGAERSPREIERLVEFRMQRQGALESAHGLDFHCCLDESTLYRAVGSAAVLDGQLAHLLTVMERGSAQVRVLPFAAGLVAAARRPFAKIAFNDDAVQSGVVYLEGPWSGGEFLGEPAELEAYEAGLVALHEASLGGDDAVALVRRARSALTDDPGRHPVR